MLTIFHSIFFCVLFFCITCQAGDSWKNLFWCGADGTYSVNNRYAKSMGYDYVGYRSFGTTAQYYNDVNTQDMFIYESRPWGRAIRALTGQGNDAITYSAWAGYSTATKNFFLDNIGWGTTTAGTFYKALVKYNNTASSVAFTLYDEAGAVLWTDSLSTNIGTVTGRELGAGILSVSPNATSDSCVKVDLLGLGFSKELTR